MKESNTYMLLGAIAQAYQDAQSHRRLHQHYADAQKSQQTQRCAESMLLCYEKVEELSEDTIQQLFTSNPGKDITEIVQQAIAL